MLKTAINDSEEPEGQRVINSTFDDEGGTLDEEKEITWSLPKNVLLFSVCLVQTVESASVYLISSFFPNVVSIKLKFSLVEI